MMRSRSGISPVVATVILVAVAIVIAIAVAFWASGLVGVFTRYEKIEIYAAYATSPTSITISVRNTGSSPATIDNILVNGIPCADSDICSSVNPDPASSTVYLSVGGAQDFTITIASGYSGTTLEIAVHTAAGKTYPVSVLIP